MLFRVHTRISILRPNNVCRSLAKRQRMKKTHTHMHWKRWHEFQYLSHWHCNMYIFSFGRQFESERQCIWCYVLAKWELFLLVARIPTHIDGIKHCINSKDLNAKRMLKGKNGTYRLHGQWQTHTFRYRNAKHIYHRDRLFSSSLRSLDKMTL